MFLRFDCMKKGPTNKQEVTPNNTSSKLTPAQTVAIKLFEEKAIRDREQLAKQLEEFEQCRVKF